MRVTRASEERQRTADKACIMLSKAKNEAASPCVIRVDCCECLRCDVVATVWETWGSSEAGSRAGDRTLAYGSSQSVAGTAELLMALIGFMARASLPFWCAAMSAGACRQELQQLPGA
eukprot:2871268-Rhodomonas_salina.1